MRTKRISILTALSLTALSACGGGGGTTIEVGALEAWKIAEKTVLKAYDNTKEPGLDDIREAFDEVKQGVQLSDYWHLLDKSSTQVEVQLWEPKPEDVITPDTAGASEHRLVESDATTTVPEEKSVAEEEVTTTVSSDAKKTEDTHSDTATSSPEAGSEKSGETETTVDHSTMHGSKDGNKVLLQACITMHEGEWESSNGACETDAEEGHGASETKSASHWSYDGSEGPEKWGSLNDEWLACEMGTSQSPIELSGAEGADLENPAFAYKKGEAKIEDNGHAVVFTPATQNTVKLEDTTWTLKQMHYHTPGEHSIDGKKASAEVHFVHQDDGGHYMVIGLMIKGGASKDAWSFAGESESAVIDWASLLPADLTTVRYKGSLTTPPCSEGVKWVLMTSTVEVTDKTLSALQSHHAGNSRPVQPTGDRIVERDLTVEK
jgi:carbonic anhydrase